MASAQTSAPDPVATGIKLAQINFHLVHQQLVNQCRNQLPESVPTLSAAIAAWEARNLKAAQELRKISIINLMAAKRLSEPDAKAQENQIAELMTAGAKAHIAATSDADLKVACEGQYAAQTLASPEMDFEGLLKRLMTPAAPSENAPPADTASPDAAPPAAPPGPAIPP